jgi:nucleotide-binding universal stress UspA family protein
MARFGRWSTRWRAPRTWPRASRAFTRTTPAIRQQLEEVIAQRTPTGCNVRIDPVVRRGPPWEKLANVATELGADIIVVGADGQRGAARQGLLGTVASRLVTTSPRTVVVVPSDLRPDLAES